MHRRVIGGNFMATLLNHLRGAGDYTSKTSSETLPLASDEQLLACIADGDERAFSELYQRHSVAILNYLARLVHEATEAEDLLQDTFVAVWRGAAQYRGQAQVKTWIYRIAHNLAVSCLRRRKPLTSFDEMDDVGQEQEPEQVLLHLARGHQLQEALDRLSPKHRAVLELAFVQEMPYIEIAAILDCPLGTVKSRISYALKSLKQNHSDAD